MHDSLGAVEIPAGALYRAQTQRAVDNFKFSSLKLPVEMIRALCLIKRCCAEVNADIGLLDADIAGKIIDSADAIISGQHGDQFPVDIFQTGSGTSSNMNVNEVIASLASTAASPVHANDHVNMGQSSNDVFPSAIHVSAGLAIHDDLLPSITLLEQSLLARKTEYQNQVKTGRTHLMDALPITLGQEISAWASQVKNDRYRIQSTLTRLQQLAIGGTAVGTGVNTSDDFGTRVCSVLKSYTGVRFIPMENSFEAISTQNTAVEISGQLRVLATSLTKISNDLRWMNSGPLTGLAEIELKALQPGSSIMPAKVNPVIPEAVLMVCAQVNGNDATIALAGQSGNFQLNVMLPIIAYNLLQSIEILANACRSLATLAIDTFQVNTSRLEQNLALNPILVTALNPIIGYEKAAEIAKMSIAQGRNIVDVALEMTDIDEHTLRKIMDPFLLTQREPEGKR